MGPIGLVILSVWNRRSSIKQVAQSPLPPSSKTLVPMRSNELSHRVIENHCGQTNPQPTFSIRPAIFLTSSGRMARTKFFRSLRSFHMLWGSHSEGICKFRRFPKYTKLIDTDHWCACTCSHVVLEFEMSHDVSATLSRSQVQSRPYPTLKVIALPQTYGDLVRHPPWPRSVCYGLTWKQTVDKNHNLSTRLQTPLKNGHVNDENSSGEWPDNDPNGCDQEQLSIAEHPQRMQTST